MQKLKITDKKPIYFDLQILKIKQSKELLQFAHKVHVTLYKMRGPFSNQESQLQPRKKNV